MIQAKGCLVKHYLRTRLCLLFLATGVTWLIELTCRAIRGKWMKTDCRPLLGQIWKRGRQTAPLLASLLASLLLPGCGQFFPPATSTGSGSSGGTGSGGGTGTGSGASTTLNSIYVANSNPQLNSIAALSLTNGKLVNLQNSPLALGQGLIPNALAISPRTNLLYAGSALGGIFAFVIQTNGSLVISGNNGPVAGQAANAMVVDPSGQWLLAMASLGSSAGIGATPEIYIFRITQSSGAITLTGQVALDNGTPAQLQFAPNGTQLYATLSTGGIDALTFSPSTGVLNKLSYLRAPLGNSSSDNGMATDPAGKYLFVAETGTSGVRVFTINTNTTLTEVAGSPFIDTATSTPPLGARAVLVDKTGAYVYVTNSTAGNISAFTLGTTGALTEITGSPFGTGGSPYSLAESSTGSYLAVACAGGSPDLQVFSITPSTGALVSFSTATTGGVSPAAATAVATTP